MATNLTHYDLPVPTKEKIARVGFWILAGVVGIAGINFIGPHALSAVNTVFDITNALVRFGVLVGSAFVGILVVRALWPAIVNGIAVMGYQALNFMRENYPLEQLAIWYDVLKQKLQITKDGRSKTKAVQKQYVDKVKGLDDELRDLSDAINGGGLTPEAKTDVEDRVAGILSVRGEYQKLVDQLAEPIEILDLFVAFQERQAAAYKRIMDTSAARHEVDGVVRTVNKALRTVFGDNPEKENAIIARDIIVNNLGRTFGELDSMQDQARLLIQAASTNDQIALSQAKKFLMDRMRTIEGSAIRIPDAIPVSGKPARLLDR